MQVSTSVVAKAGGKSDAPVFPVGQMALFVLVTVDVE